MAKKKDLPAKVGKQRLTLDKMYTVAALAEDYLPQMVDRLFQDFMAGALSGKEMVAAVRVMHSFALGTDRLKEDLGIAQKQRTSVGGSPLLVMLADKIDVKTLKTMTQDTRQALILDALRGNEEAVQKVIDVEPLE